jgi:hypothetical protein
LSGATTGQTKMIYHQGNAVTAFVNEEISPPKSWPPRS